jgi:hypothetical protein
MMKKLLLLLPIVGLLAMASLAQASPWHRGCGNHNDGFLTNNLKFEVSGPVYVGMHARTAYSIDRRVGPSEFGSRVKAKDVPCSVAWTVAGKAANAWVHWPGNSGTVGVRWSGYSYGPYLGRFHCHGYNRNNAAHETCHHNGDRHAGPITVQFKIRAANG